MEYEVQYLPSAMQDMVDIIRYISHELCNPTAAEKLSDDFIKAADRLQLFPYASTAYAPIKPLKHEYRKLPVQNYMMFYWVDEEIKAVTIARVIYARRDYEKLL